MPLQVSSRRVLVTAIAVVLGLACGAVAAQAKSWEYKSYKKTQGGQYDKNVFNVGAITLDERDGKAFFHMTAGNTDACLRGEIPALVTRTDATTTIELQQPLAGCDVVRYVIRNDGSGGDREVQRGEKWVKDKFDHGLTPKP
jgi:hypothetical protein